MGTSNIQNLHPNHYELIRTFYSSFASGDADTMVACYHTDIIFTDPAFGVLHGKEVAAMWRMLLERSKGELEITFDNVRADDQFGATNWVATYVFQSTGRKVVNRISAEFEFKDELIVRHTDDFDFWSWSRQALGWKGLLLGWTPWMQKKVQKQTNRALQKYSGNNRAWMCCRKKLCFHKGFSTHRAILSAQRFNTVILSSLPIFNYFRGFYTPPLNYTRSISPLLLLVFGLLALVACKKTEIQEVHEPYLIEGNDPPDYNGVTTLQVQNYVGRAYIDLLGEQPSVDVLQEKVVALQSADLSMESRAAFIAELMEDEEYYVNVYNYTAEQFINGVPRSEIQEQIDVFEFVIEQYYDQGEIQLAQFLEYEVQKLQALIEADTEWAAGNITLNEFYGRFCYNGIYDEINMGSENMVIACFENLFGRYPTNNELENGVVMVDGISAILLQQNGNSKTDFVQIVTHTSEFYLGLVFEQYQRLLTRSPEPIEEQNGSVLLATEDLQAFQTSIIITDEYAGF